MKKRVSVIVTDLDDTLWDWVDIWYRPFKAMLDKVVEISGVPQKDLLSDFKEVFTRYGTSEYAFALQELPSLLRKDKAEDIPNRYAKAIEAYRNARREALRLYPEVSDTLERIKDRGTLIVGYTESLAFYTCSRLRKFELDRTLDFLYSPPDHDLPKGLAPEEIRKYSPEHYELRRTIHRHTPSGSEKPSPQVLLNILNSVGAIPDETIYVGDKLVKDVAMAQDAGVTDVHAAYGEAHNREEYELLRSVTHWTPSAVKKEQETTTQQVSPSYTLGKSIAELHDYFEFIPYVDRTEARTERIVEIWGKAVDVQQHFNELEMKIRNYVITLVVAVIGAAGFAVREHLPILARLLPLAGVAGVGLFCMMDALWYHKLLIGAVNHARFIERRFARHLPEIGLTTAIGKASPSQLWRWKVHSTHKLWIFYGGIILLLVLVAIFLPRFVSPAGVGGQTNQGQVKTVPYIYESDTKAAGQAMDNRGRTCSE